MGLRDLVKKALRPKAEPINVKTSAAGPVIAFNNVGRPKWTPRRYDTLADEGFRKNVIAYRCAMVVATSAAAIPWLLYDDAVAGFAAPYEDGACRDAHYARSGRAIAG